MVLLVVALLLASPAHSKVIRDDRGGNVLRYSIEVKAAQARGEMVEVRGSCASACTLYLALPLRQICVTPRARFRFHAPYNAGRDGAKVKAYMMRLYPAWVREWIADQGGLTSRMIEMDYRTAGRFIPTC